MSFLPWLVFPAVGAVIGYGTNWLAVKMLFRPRDPLRIAGLRFQGLVPRRKSELAESVARTVEQELLSKEDIRSIVVGLAESERVRSLLRDRVDGLITEQMKSFGPLVRTFVSQDLLEKLKGRIEAEIVGFLGGMSEELHRGLGEHLDIHEMVKARIESFELERLEQIVERIARRELRHIELLGGVLGGAIGVVEAGILALL